MKKSTLLLSIVTLSVAASTVTAQDAPTSGPRASRQAIIKKYDTNGDGQLDDAERRAAREDFQKLSDAARETENPPAAPAPQDGRVSREDMMKKYDRNGDGKLDETERNALREEIMKSRAGTPEGRGAVQTRPGANREAMIKEFDKDGDGKLSDTERQVAMVELRKRYQAQVLPGRPGVPDARASYNREEVLKQYDKDGDGKLNDTERAAMRDATRKNMEKRRPRPEQGPATPAPATEGKKN